MIPKVDNPSDVSQFRPIACCTVVYKTISKILATRLQAIMPIIVGEEQSAFIKGRSIHDNIFLAHNLMKHYGRAHISPRAMLKVDIKKAFDSMNWSFLENALLCLNFPALMIKWIMACISSTYFTIALNGNLYGFIKGARGIRQGDPLSPYLFVLAMEILSRLLRKCRTVKHFSHHPKCSKLNITHLAFADDLLIFTRGDVPSIMPILDTLNFFGDISGLIPNPQKSNIYFGGVCASLRRQILQATGFVEETCPFRYLGVPLCHVRLTRADYNGLVSKISMQLQHWSTNFLSYAGKLQLLNSVIFGTLVFWCSIFILPKAVVQKINKVCRDFFWGQNQGCHKLHMLAWDAFALPYREGGANFKEILGWNRAACLKWLQKLHIKGDSLWVKWMYTYVIKASTCWSVQSKVSDPWLWKNLLLLRGNFFVVAGGLTRALELFNKWANVGKFSVIDAYHLFRKKGVPVKANDVVWDNLASPRHRVIAWLAMKGKLATIDQLQRRGLIIVNKALLYSQNRRSRLN